MIPTSRALILLTLWATLGLGASVFPASTAAWGWLGGAIGIALIVDAIVLATAARPAIWRVLPERFALGQEAEVEVVVRNASSRCLGVELFDGIPDGGLAPQLPWRGQVPAREEIRVLYAIRFVQRGRVDFGLVHFRQCTRLGLWSRAGKSGDEAEAKVYPNYEPVVRFALLAMEARQDQMGIVRRSLAGSSRDFHQLREYREGDPLSQIDWKASSRRLALISREYQEQRDQTLVFLTDTGRRMRAMDGELAQFDHCLNAMLLMSYVALRQGDAVGFQSFGGSDRWLAPVKGSTSMATVLNHVFDYQTTLDPTDFTAGAEQLQTRQRRRALVLVLTNLRGEDAPEILPALRGLATRHLVLLASLREQSVEQARVEPVASFGSALRFAAAERYDAERAEVLSNLRSHGILTLDVPAQDLPVALANRYLEIKAQGTL